MAEFPENPSWNDFATAYTTLLNKLADVIELRSPKAKQIANDYIKRVENLNEMVSSFAAPETVEMMDLFYESVLATKLSNVACEINDILRVVIQLDTKDDNCIMYA